jgi:hypothetical protein
MAQESAFSGMRWPVNAIQLFFYLNGKAPLHGSTFTPAFHETGHLTVSRVGSRYSLERLMNNVFQFAEFAGPPSVLPLFRCVGPKPVIPCTLFPGPIGPRLRPLHSGFRGSQAAQGLLR